MKWAKTAGRKRISQRMMAVATNGTIRQITIGNRSDIRTRADRGASQAFYRKHYQPDNAMLVIAEV